MIENSERIEIVQAPKKNCFIFMRLIFYSLISAQALILNLLKGGEYSPYMYGSDRSRSQRDSYRLAQELNDLHIKVIILCFE